MIDLPLIEMDFYILILLSASTFSSVIRFYSSGYGVWEKKNKKLKKKLRNAILVS